MQQIMQDRGTHTLPGLIRLSAIPLGVAIGLGGVCAALLVVQMGCLARIVDDLAFRSHPFSAEHALIGSLLAATLARCLLQWCADMAGERAGILAVSSLRQHLFRHLFRVGPVGLAGEETGAIATALTDGIDTLHPYIAQYLPRAAAMVVLPLLILGVVAGLDGWSFLILACTGPLIPVFMALVGFRAQAMMDRQWAQLLLLGSSFLDSLQGLTTLRLFGRARERVSMVIQMAEGHRQSTMQVMRVAFLTSAVLEFFSSLAIALVAIVFGARLLTGHVTFYTAFFVLLLAPEYFAPLRAFSASYHARQNAVSAMTRLSALMALPELQGDAPSSLPSAPLASIICRDLRAGYGDGPDVLLSLSATFSSDVLSVITGASGSGKSTLIRLLLGMMPVRSGKISGLDEAGHPIPQKAWKIGWVPQAPTLLDGTIADTLRLAAPDADIEHLRKAASLAGVLTFIENLPDGFDTKVGEHGAALSGGEIRRLVLARALLTDPQVLVFDEPTADLDPENAARVAASIQRLARGRIVIAISHRPDVLSRAGQVLCLRDGRLVPEMDKGIAA